MAPGKNSKSSSSEKKRFVTSGSSKSAATGSSKSKGKSSKGKERASAEKPPKRPTPDAVLKYAQKRGITLAESESDDDGMRKPPRKRRKAAKKKTWDDFVEREMPIPRDYGAAFAAKSTAHYTWGAPMTFTPPLPKAPELKKAVAATNAKGKGKGKKTAKCATPFLDESDDDDIYGPPSPDPTPNKPKHGSVIDLTTQDMPTGKIWFMKFPPEIRDRIYGFVLVADNPVQVRQGWSTLYPRNRPCLDTAILRTSRDIWKEAIDIFYGGNKFLYLLRETAPARVCEAGDGEDEIVVQHPLAPMEEYSTDYDADDDDEYNDDMPLTGASKNPHVEIAIHRYGHKFRQIKILAEPNRTEKGYLLSMANAISVFRNLKPIKCRIHTIEIEITPSHDRETGDLTFLNFFEKTSEVMKALRGLPCQFIEIIVNISDRQKQERIRVNMKYAAKVRRARRGEDDPWKGDLQMENYRIAAAGEAQAQLDNIPASIHAFWDGPKDKNKAQGSAILGDGDEDDDDEDDEDDDFLWGQDYD
ncbi:hypothetical protein CKAH01_11930 [Colletotrichum kahawae]|uniref:Uncharacterized protein n=1 Tax=Colletotrichum kahawae TaxID=34407 RepID=A0AAE0DFR3_COLKA|nr:hypothetical protein CKAH01_11930 [Colletotrichum kahawae]